MASVLVVSDVVWRFGRHARGRAMIDGAIAALWAMRCANAVRRVRQAAGFRRLCSVVSHKQTGINCVPPHCQCVVPFAESITPARRHRSTQMIVGL